MASEWTGHTGSCVQYRTVDGKVFVRDSTDPERMVEFTAAEWDTFVAGLVGDETELAEARGWARHGYEIGQRSCTWSDHGVAPAWLTEGHDPASLIGTPHAGCLEVEAKLTAERDQLLASLTELAPSSLAAENARLRQQLAELKDERDFHAAHADLIATIADSIWAEKSRLRQQLATAERDVADALVAYADMAEKRTQLFAEAAVLRHRDRRTQAVVEAAQAWFDHRRGSLNALADTLDALQECPPARLSATESADQAQVVPESTPGPETQREAQGATAVIWHHGCGRTYTADGGPLDCRCGDYTLQWSTYFNSTAPPIVDDGTAIKVKWTVPGPRVWNAGDPEPGGVEKVVDREGTVWQRSLVEGWWAGVVAALPVDFPGASWEHALGWAPLTEVLPEPAPTADNDHDPDWVDITECIRSDARAVLKVTMDNADGRFVPTEPLTQVTFHTADLWDPADEWVNPDGEVPEAGRVGEAPKAAANSPESTPVPGDEVGHRLRTEGLDAAIEAAMVAAFPGLPDGMTLAEARRRTAAAVRAASPLIERAALLAAADDWMVDWLAEGTGFPENTDAWLKRRAPQVGGGQ